MHAPAVELLSRSKLSCLSWNKYIQAHIASSDYEGGPWWGLLDAPRGQGGRDAHVAGAWSSDGACT